MSQSSSETAAARRGRRWAQAATWSIVTYGLGCAMFALMDHEFSAGALAVISIGAGICTTSPRIAAMERARRRHRFDRRCRRNAAR